jgi:hypothetical protein
MSWLFLLPFISPISTATKPKVEEVLVIHLGTSRIQKGAAVPVTIGLDNQIIFQGVTDELFDIPPQFEIPKNQLKADSCIWTRLACTEEELLLSKAEEACVCVSFKVIGQADAWTSLTTRIYSEWSFNSHYCGDCEHIER